MWKVCAIAGILVVCTYFVFCLKEDGIVPREASSKALLAGSVSVGLLIA